MPPFFRGYGEPRDPWAVLPPSITALRTALEVVRLTILALDPLTNIAAVLDGRPDLYGKGSHASGVSCATMLGHALNTHETNPVHVAR